MKKKLTLLLLVVFTITLLTSIGVYAGTSTCQHGSGTYEVYSHSVQRIIRTYSKQTYNSLTGEYSYKPWVTHGKFMIYNVYCKKCNSYMGSRENGPVETYDSPAY